MASPLRNEIQGDWNNLKGTEYHLVYAIWSLLCGSASQVMFYQGNDLLAYPAPPPILKGSEDNLPAVPLQATKEDEDLWIQLKATKQPWIPSLLLQDNLLSNFMLNALLSQKNNRVWSVKLVTSARIQPEVDKFITQLKQNPGSNNRLRQIITDVQEKWIEAFPNSASLEESDLLMLALDILAKLAQTESVSLRALKAEIEAELAYTYPDREAVRQLGVSLLGTLLQDAAAGPSAAQKYDIEWLNRAAGRPVKKRGLLDSDPVAACTESITTTLPRNWNPGYCIPRQNLENTLQQFLGSPQLLFVLLGMSGTGKSWAVADWVTKVLAGNIKLLINGADLDHWSTLDELVAKQLRPRISADWQPDVFLTKLAASASVKARVQPVIVIDDLKLPSRNAEVFRRDLARLVKDGKERGIKLVITCQKQVWDFYNLGAEILREDVFVPDFLPIETKSPVPEEGKTNTRTEEDQPRYSFLLSDLTPEELEDLLLLRFTPERAERAFIALRRPEYAALRNPYLLMLFLEENSDFQVTSWKEHSFPDIDSLLDQRVNDLLRTAAIKLSCSPNDLRSAFILLVEQLWKVRPGDLAYSQAIDCLATVLREQGGNALAALRQVGLLTPVGSIRIAEPLVAERLFAMFVAGASLSETAIAEELRPEVDAGVLRVLLRSGITPTIPLVESLLTKDERWREIVSEGLALVPQSDYRILALISILARPNVDGYTRLTMSEPLGKLATRDRRAKRWVTQMYLSGDEMERHRGEYALGTAIEIDAKRVEGVLRLRLSQARKKRPAHLWQEEKYLRWIRDAVHPLAHIDNKESAYVGRRLLHRYDRIFKWHRAQAYAPLLVIVDEVQGQIASFGTEGDLETLLDDLRSEDEDVRFHRACALRLVAFQQPKRIQESLFEAIRKEKDGAVLVRLLIASHPLISIDSHGLLEALEAGIAVQWNNAILTNTALGLLSALADKHPHEVLRLLPSRLEGLDSADQALLSDPLAYAWWHCAKQIPECRDRLNDLAKLELKDMEEKYRPFALRGAATAQLASMALDTAPTHTIPLLYSSGDRMLYYVDAADLAQENALAFVRHPDYAKLQDLLVRCINAEEHGPPHMPGSWLSQEAFHCARLSLELLIRFASALDDPLPILKALPHDWQALRVAWRLLKAGRTDREIVAFAREEYEAHKTSRSVQADYDMDMCFLQLAQMQNDPQQVLEEQKSKPRFLFDRGSGEARTWALLTDTNPSELLSLLNTNIKNDDSVTVLFEWEKETRSWRSLLIARVYARMFSPSRIAVSECYELCLQMLTAVRSLPDSNLRREYKAVYSTILDWLQGDSTTPQGIGTPASVIEQSHDFALSLLHKALEKRTERGTHEWIEEVFSERQGWLEIDDYKFEDGEIICSSPSYLIYFLPAVRLALAAVGRYYQLLDPAGTFMAKRVESFKVIEDNRMVLREPFVSNRQQLNLALRDIRAQLKRAPQDERLWQECGLLLILLGHLQAAEESLKHCLESRLCDNNLRGTALYNLACVYARTGREDECRLALEDSKQLHPLKKDLMQTDSDLESVRERDWFRTLIET